MADDRVTTPSSSSGNGGESVDLTAAEAGGGCDELDGDRCDQLCKQFANVTGTDEACGHFFLQDTNWNIEAALDNFYRASAQGDNGESSPPHADDSDNEDSGAAAATRFKLLSWNVDGLDERNLKTRMRAVLQIVETERPDVIVLQEVIEPVYEAMQVRLAQHYNIVSGRDDNSLVAYFTCAAVRRSFAHIRQVNVSPYPSTMMGRTLLTLNVCLRNASESEGGAMCVLTTHLESTGEHSRERTKQLRTCLEAMRGPALAGGGSGSAFSVLAGDLNLRDKELVEAGGLGDKLHDAWERTGSKAFTRYTWDCVRNDNVHFEGRYKPRCRFDRCWYTAGTQWKCTDFMLLGMQRIKTIQCFPSDHFGLLCTFVREDKSSTASTGAK